MADFQILMLPLLECLRDGQEHSMDYIQEQVIVYLEYSDNLQELFATQSLIEQAVRDASQHLVRAGLIRATGTGFCITPFGKMILGRRLNTLTVEFLRQLPGYTLH